MLCERCGKREATVNVVCVINDTRVSKWLCESCAKEFAAEGVMAGQKGAAQASGKELSRRTEPEGSFLYRSGRKDSGCRAPDSCPAPAERNWYRTYFVGDAAGTGEPGSTSVAAVRRG